MLATGAKEVAVTGKGGPTLASLCPSVAGEFRLALFQEGPDAFTIIGAVAGRITLPQFGGGERLGIEAAQGEGFMVAVALR